MDDAAPQPFPPPTIPQVPAEVYVVSTPPPAPPRRRVGLLVGAAVVVVAAIVAGVVLFNGGKSDATYSLKAASQAAAVAQNVEFEMTISAGPADITMTARVDVERQLMAMSASMPALTDQGPVQMILDSQNKVMYMDASAFPGAGELPTTWISMDLSKVPGAAESFGGVTGANPLDTARLFDGATDIQDKGVEDLNGEQVKHYVVTIDTAEALAAQPDLFDQLTDATEMLPDTIAYDVWVTEDNQLRRMSFSLDVAGQTVDMDMKVTAIGTIDPIELPAADQVTDMTDLLSAG